ncbi:MAG: RDD family protein, partial [Proteobacteria bacterium]|nr:RDD family protein [Pseudomonadota bacterium]
MSRPRPYERTIRTPEGVSFTIPLAGPVRRGMAWSLDLLMVMALSGAVSAGVHSLAPLSRDLAQALAILAYFVLSVGYGVLLEWFFRGQTLGKRVFSLRVLDVRGLPLSFPQVMIRNLLRFVDSLPLFYMLGGLASVISPRAQRLGDIVAGTVVALEKDFAPPDLAQIQPEKYNSLSAWPHLVARLRHRATQEQADLALDAVLAREDLLPGARILLFAELARGFSGLVPFPPEATEGMSDEKYVRNVVQGLFA